MRLLKTHSYTSNGLAMEPGAREDKQLKKTQTVQQGITHQQPAACRRCRGGGRKSSRTCRIPPVWRGGGQERLYGEPPKQKVLWRGDGGAGVPSKADTNTVEPVVAAEAVSCVELRDR